MKRLCPLIFFCLIFGLGYFFPVSAQNKTSAENYQDLLQSYREYQGLLEPFNSKKSRHLTYQSVDSRAELLEAAKVLLGNEAKAITAYTAFIKSFLAEATQVLNYQESFLYVKLDDELAYLKQAPEKANSLSSLAEVDQFSLDLKSHYGKISVIGYQIKSLVLVQSAKKVLENIKTQRESLNRSLTELDRQDSQVLAAREKFAGLDKELAGVETKLAQAENKGKDFGSGTPKTLTDQIRNTVNEATTAMGRIITGYNNIVSSLR